MRIINEKLYNDLFIESHQKLAIKSLQTLNNSENLLISKIIDTDIYHIIPIIHFQYLTTNNIVINSEYIEDFEAYFSIGVSNQKMVFLIVNDCIYRATYFSSPTIKSNKESIDIEFAAYKYYINSY